MPGTAQVVGPALNGLFTGLPGTGLNVAPDLSVPGNATLRYYSEHTKNT